MLRFQIPVTNMHLVPAEVFFGFWLKICGNHGDSHQVWEKLMEYCLILLDEMKVSWSVLSGAFEQRTSIEWWHEYERIPQNRKKAFSPSVRNDKEKVIGDDWGISILAILVIRCHTQRYGQVSNICLEVLQKQLYAQRGRYFCKAQNWSKLHFVVSSHKGWSSWFPRLQFAWWMLKWEGANPAPQSWLDFFFQPNMANPNPNPLHPHAELHERQWRTNLLHEHGSLSLANTSNIQHLARATVPFQKKSSSSCEAAQCRFDFVVTSLVCSCCFWGDKVQIEYLYLLLLSCEKFATHRMILRSV